MFSSRDNSKIAIFAGFVVATVAAYFHFKKNPVSVKPEETSTDTLSEKPHMTQLEVETEKSKAGITSSPHAPGCFCITC